MNGVAFEHLMQGTQEIHPIINDGQFCYSISIAYDKGNIKILIPFIDKDSIGKFFELFNPEQPDFERFKKHIKLFKDLYFTLRPGAQIIRKEDISSFEILEDHFKSMLDFANRCLGHSNPFLQRLGFGFILTHQVNGGMPKKADSLSNDQKIKVIKAIALSLVASRVKLGLKLIRDILFDYQSLLSPLDINGFFTIHLLLPSQIQQLLKQQIEEDEWPAVYELAVGLLSIFPSDFLNMCI